MHETPALQRGPNFTESFLTAVDQKMAEEGGYEPSEEKNQWTLLTYGAHASSLHFMQPVAHTFSPDSHAILAE